MSAERRLYLFIGVSIALRIALVLILHQIHPSALYVNDSPEYIHLAENIVAGHGFSLDTTAPYTPNSFRTPGYPIFLLISKAVTGTFIIGLLLQCILAGGIALLIFKIAQSEGWEKQGLWAATVFLCMPFSLLVPLQFLTQTVFTFCVALSLFAYLQYLKTKRLWYIVICALLLAIASLTRPIGQYLPSIFILVSILALYRQSLTLKQAAAAMVILLGIYGAVLTPWLLHNQKTFGVFALSSITPAFLYLYDTPAIYATAHHISFEEARTDLIYDMEYETGVSIGDSRYVNFSPLSKLMQQRAVEIMLESPTAFVLTRIELGFNFFFRDGVRYWFEALGAPYSYLHWYTFLALAILERLVLLTFILGMAWTIIKGLWEWRTVSLTTVLLTLACLYFMTLTGSMASAGLRYPAEPFFLLLGTVGLFQIYRYFSTKLQNT